MKRPLLLINKENKTVAEIEDGGTALCPIEPVTFAVPIEGWFQEKERTGRTVRQLIKYSDELQLLQPGKYYDVSFRENGDGAIAVRYDFELLSSGAKYPTLGVVTQIYGETNSLNRLVEKLRELKVDHISVWWTCGSIQNREFFRRMLAENIKVEIVISRQKTSTISAQNASEASANARSFT
ncbi:MAG: hypothetical protein ACRC78_00765, partial [Planktothrix sp.]